MEFQPIQILAFQLVSDDLLFEHVRITMNTTKTIAQMLLVTFSMTR